MATHHIMTALFDSRAAAERAVEHLVQRCGLDRAAIRVHAGGEENVAAGTHARRSEDHHGFVANSGSDAGLPQDLPPEDRLAFADRLRQGGIVVMAAVPDHLHDDAIRACEENGAVALDDRSRARRDRDRGADLPGSTARFAAAGADRDAGGPRAGQTGGWQGSATGEAIGLRPDGQRSPGGGPEGPVVGGQTSGGAARTRGGSGPSRTGDSPHAHAGEGLTGEARGIMGETPGWIFPREESAARRDGPPPAGKPSPKR